MAVKIKGSEVVRLARQALAEGWAYCWGWNGDKTVDEAALKKFKLDRKFLGKKGADCSGLITWICKALKTGLGDTTAQGWYNRSRKLADAAHMQSGDIVCAADRNGKIYHIGVFVGSGIVIEESGPATGIRETNMPGGWNRYARLPFVIDEPRESTRIVTAAKSLNVRSGPGLTYKVLGTVHHNDKVTSTGKTSGKWVEIKYGSGTAWVSGKYLA